MNKDTKELKAPKDPNEQKAPKDPNIFDLSALALKNEEEVKKNVAAVITEDEQKKLLMGYEEVPNQKWESLINNIHIRYLRKDGIFRRGGFVKNTWVGLHGNSQGKKCIQLSSNINYNSNKWTICFDDIDKIWQKISMQTNQVDSTEMQNSVKKNNESIDFLLKSVEKLNIDIARLSNEQQRIINLIKKLHNIKIAN